MEERFGVDCLLLLYTKVISVLGGRLMDQKITMIPHHLMTWEQERERYDEAWEAAYENREE